MLCPLWNDASDPSHYTRPTRYPRVRRDGSVNGMRDRCSRRRRCVVVVDVVSSPRGGGRGCGTLVVVGIVVVTLSWSARSSSMRWSSRHRRGTVVGGTVVGGEAVEVGGATEFVGDAVVVADTTEPLTVVDAVVTATVGGAVITSPLTDTGACGIDTVVD